MTTDVIGLFCCRKDSVVGLAGICVDILEDTSQEGGSVSAGRKREMYDKIIVGPKRVF